MEKGTYFSPVGWLEYGIGNQGVEWVDFLTQKPEERKAEGVLARQLERELTEYFEGRRREFSLPLHPCGTPFQIRVWRALLEIPYGETRSYQEIATAVGNPKACRAVGMANNKNPLPLLIPCHRVIGSSGKLTGYGGGLDKKEKLLALEKEGRKQAHLEK